MNENNNKNRFGDLNLFEKILVITAITLLIVLSITFVLGSYFFGIVGFFNLFGVQYTSPYSLIGFVILFFLFGVVVDLFSIAFIKLLSQYISGKYKLFIARMVIDCTFTWLALHTVDEFMNSITIPLTTQIVAVLLLFFIEVAFDVKEKNKKEFFYLSLFHMCHLFNKRALSCRKVPLLVINENLIRNLFVIIY